MVLNRNKRSNAGKAPQRLDEPALSIPPPLSTQSKRSKKTAQSLKRLMLSIKNPQTAQFFFSISSISFRQERTISIVSESPESLLSNNNSSIAQQQKEKKKEKQKKQKKKQKKQERKRQSEVCKYEEKEGWLCTL